MKRLALYALAGAAVYAAYRTAVVYPIYKSAGDSVRNGLNPLNPMLYAAAAVGVVIGWATK